MKKNSFNRFVIEFFVVSKAIKVCKKVPRNFDAELSRERKKREIYPQRDPQREKDFNR